MSRAVRLPFLVALSAPAALAAILSLPTHALSQGRSDGEADSMFRFLDANRDGRLTLDEGDGQGQGQGNSRRMLQQIFQMAGKPDNGAVSRDEFQRVYDQHKVANGRRQPPNGDGGQNSPNRPGGAAPGGPASSDRNADRSVERNDERNANRAPGRNMDRDNARSTDRENARTPARRNTSARSPLEGVWRGWVVDGRGERPNDGQMELELTIQGNTITGRELGTRRAPGGVGSGTFTMTAMNGTSGQLDADGTEGPTQGRFYAGIYELQGDTLRWCVSNRARQRPDQMATDRGNYLMILHRVR